MAEQAAGAEGREAGRAVGRDQVGHDLEDRAEAVRQGVVREAGLTCRSLPMRVSTTALDSASTLPKSIGAARRQGVLGAEDVASPRR